MEGNHHPSFRRGKKQVSFFMDRYSCSKNCFHPGRGRASPPGRSRWRRGRKAGGASRLRQSTPGQTRLWRCEPGSGLAAERVPPPPLSSPAGATLPGGLLPLTLPGAGAGGGEVGGGRLGWREPMGGFHPSAPRGARVWSCPRGGIPSAAPAAPPAPSGRPPAVSAGGDSPWVSERLFDRSSAPARCHGTAAGGGTGRCPALFPQHPPLPSPAMEELQSISPGPADSSARQASSSSCRPRTPTRSQR